MNLFMAASVVAVLSISPIQACNSIANDILMNGRTAIAWGMSTTTCQNKENTVVIKYDHAPEGDVVINGKSYSTSYDNRHIDSEYRPNADLSRSILHSTMQNLNVENTGLSWSKTYCADVTVTHRLSGKLELKKADNSIFESGKGYILSEDKKVLSVNVSCETSSYLGD